ncbi:MAG: S9 family peptidase [Candidatus Sumerlaeia bacterium]|nr:S9 family peptidase [Candidatus Sumerlaeia bacterium]
MATLIPRKLLFGNPDRSEATISPCGQWLAWLAPLDGVKNLWVAPTADSAAPRAVTRDAGRGVHVYRWAYDGAHLLVQQDTAGDENYRLFAYPLDGGPGRLLTPQEGVRVTIQNLSPEHPHRVVVGLNHRDPRYQDVWTIDLRSGESREVLRNEAGWAGFDFRRDLTGFLGSRFEENGDLTYTRLDGPRAGEVFLRLPADETMTTEIMGYDSRGRWLYLRDSRGRDTAALCRMDLESGAVELLAEDPRCDAGETLADPRTREPLAVCFEHAKTRWQAVAPDWAGTVRALDAAFPEGYRIVSRTLDQLLLLIESTDPARPVEYHLFDRAEGAARLLFSTRADLASQRLRPMEALEVESRDGLPLVCYLTRPDAAPAPLVVLVHGGPWWRDSYRFSTWHQWLADRGYAVLSVNFRGSTGFGKRFVNAGDLQWGKAMQDDLLDAARHAIATGAADPDRVAIVGGSYGGYAALVGMTRDADFYACGVDIVGPSNLRTLLASIPPYWTAMKKVFQQRMGDDSTAEGREALDSISPLTHADRIRKPLLVVQGANDPRVKRAESDQLVAALEQRGIPVLYLLYPDEGHGMVRAENNLSANALIEAFLAKVLGGSFEAPGADFEGSSLQVPSGAGLFRELAGVDAPASSRGGGD